MLQNSEAAQRLGYLRLPAGLTIRDSDIDSMPPSKVLCIATGSQGEPFAAMSRIAINDHRSREGGIGRHGRLFGASDSRQREVDRALMNHLARRGADVIYEGIKHVHVSGHGSEEELKLMLVAGEAETISFRFTASTGSCRSMPASPSG